MRHSIKSSRRATVEGKPSESLRARLRRQHAPPRRQGPPHRPDAACFQRRISGRAMELRGGTARRYRALQPPRLRGCRIANTRECARVKKKKLGVVIGWYCFVFALIYLLTMDGLCFIRTLLQRPFQQEFRGALGTRSTIINYGKEKRCALPAGTTCQSQSEWKKPAEVHGIKHAEVVHKGEGAEQEKKGKQK